ncbi:hypothetical protein X777_10459 [Ooceraea biroi]|uniref:Uncharacterized protein n=1 Tax=Ooceraea biroi TaxID=2015173 RepID=A0A026W5D5_OOCBI|nr:hypothetical protein X777_10459 [Ooceraea biroi]
MCRKGTCLFRACYLPITVHRHAHTRVDSHDGCTHVVRLKVDRENTRKHKCAVPWMYLQIISIIDQTVALSLLIMHDEQNSAFTKTVWYIPVASIYLVLSMYFWMIVQTARRVWYEEQQNQVDYDPRISISVSAPTSSNSSKSPSFLSQNFSMFESPRPPTILCK